jgi:hypothetical protein
VRYVGEIDTLRLLGIDQPGNLPVFLNVFFDELDLIFRVALNLFVTIKALAQSRRAGKTAVLAEKMTAFTTLIDQFRVHGVIEVNRLFFLGIQQLGENDPPYDKTTREPDHKKENNRAASFTGGRHLSLTIRFNVFGVV